MENKKILIEKIRVVEAERQQQINKVAINATLKTNFEVEENISVVTVFLNMNHLELYTIKTLNKFYKEMTTDKKMLDKFVKKYTH